MAQNSETTPRWSIVVKDKDADKALVVVPVIIPVTALVMGTLAIVALIYLGMKHRERMAKIKSGAIKISR
jgi:hypothetical protein